MITILITSKERIDTFNTRRFTHRPYVRLLNGTNIKEILIINL